MRHLPLALAALPLAACANNMTDPPMAGDYALEEVATALEDLDARRAAGKVVLTLR